uniref:Uncharacterized protein n=1 Tax=Lotus japonicus TaxID=34305 RepID=I3S9J2_LOTJA|nr:unknown [Lotus japonicus]
MGFSWQWRIFRFCNYNLFFFNARVGIIYIGICHDGNSRLE